MGGVVLACACPLASTRLALLPHSASVRLRHTATTGVERRPNALKPQGTGVEQSLRATPLAHPDAVIHSRYRWL